VAQDWYAGYSTHSNSLRRSKRLHMLDRPDEISIGRYTAKDGFWVQPEWRGFMHTKWEFPLKPPLALAGLRKIPPVATKRDGIQGAIGINE